MAFQNTDTVIITDVISYNLLSLKYSKMFSVTDPKIDMIVELWLVHIQ